MARLTTIGFILAIGCFATLTFADDYEVTGLVVDRDGKPVANADISPWWRANGSPSQSDGTDYDLNDSDQVSLFWGNVGKMHPWQPGDRTDREGGFSLNTHSKMHVLVMDRHRHQGAIFRMSEKSHRDVHIKLSPLTTVRLRVAIKDSKAKPIWSHTYVHLESDEHYPLASTRLASCGSETDEMEFRLPKGTYHLETYAVSGVGQPDDIDLRVVPDQKIVIDGTGGVIDLGVLQLQPDKPDRTDLEAESKKAGRWKDYTEHFGQAAPEWYAIDTRGIESSKNVEDFRGKWLLLEFWGLGCRPCLSEHMPELIEFYNEHREQRDQFEVIGICIDIRGELKKVSDLDEPLAPIIEHVWNGNEIPFPIVLDNSFKTWETYGIPGLGASVLINPEGNVVKGGVEELKRVLEESGNRE
ncbi:MAG: TlpA disulfide reductase family protein [Planctomycetota bacterium]